MARVELGGQRLLPGRQALDQHLRGSCARTSGHCWRSTVSRRSTLLLACFWSNTSTREYSWALRPRRWHGACSCAKPSPPQPTEEQSPMTTTAVITPSTSKAHNGAAGRPILKLDSPELKALLDEFAAGASEREAKRIAPHKQIRQIADAGLGRLRIPVAEGGAGISLRELFLFLIRLGEADSNLVHILRVHYWFVEAQLQRSAIDPRRARHLALVNQGHIFGNGFSEQSQRAVGLYFDTKVTPDPSGKGHRLNGKKYYSTGSLFSNYTAIFASTP